MTADVHARLAEARARARRHPLAFAAIVMLVALIVLVAIWDWNWFKGPIERTVRIDVDGEWEVANLAGRFPAVEAALRKRLVGVFGPEPVDV